MAPSSGGVDGGNAWASDASMLEERALATQDAGESVSGTVIGWDSLRPLRGRVVWIGGRSTTTDAKGGFTLGGVVGRYDAVVVDPDGTAVSIYRGLSRRDPLLPHPGTPTLPRGASVSGDVSGGGNYPLGPQDLVVMSFFSPQADQFWPLGGGLSTLDLGPGYGPIPLQWDGPTSISGELAAFGRFRTSDGGVSSWFAQQPLTLTDGRAASMSVVLNPVVLGHISGAIDIPANTRVAQKEVFYRPPIVHARIVVPIAQSTTFDDDVPDLTDSGAQLCVGAMIRPGSSVTERCGVSLHGSDATVSLQSPPWFTSPVDGETVTKGAQLSWTNFDNGVYMVQLEAVPSTAATPRIYVFTSETSVVWPDLAGVGVPFPFRASYQCTLGGLGPYASIDDALGPDGVGAPFPTELRRSYSPTLNVNTSP